MRAIAHEHQRFLDLLRQRVGIQLGIGKVAVQFHVFRLLRLHDELALDLRFGPTNVRAGRADHLHMPANDEDLRRVQKRAVSAVRRKERFCHFAGALFGRLLRERAGRFPARFGDRIGKVVVRVHRKLRREVRVLKRVEDLRVGHRGKHRDVRLRAQLFAVPFVRAEHGDSVFFHVLDAARIELLFHKEQFRRALLRPADDPVRNARFL